MYKKLSSLIFWHNGTIAKGTDPGYNLLKFESQLCHYGLG